MGSSFQYNITAGFRVVDKLQQVIVANAAGFLKPGYNRQKLHVGEASGNQSSGPHKATQSRGGGMPTAAGGDTLFTYGTTIDFEQGQIEPAFNVTSLAIRGGGFFMVAENDAPGAKVFLTRAGDFKFDAQGRLVNNQGMFVLGGNGVVDVDASGRMNGQPPLVRANPDGTVDLPSLSLGRVASPNQLSISGYGDTIYALTQTAGPLRVFANGRPEVGFVQASSIEIQDRTGASAILSAESNTAVQTYKIFKDMLTEFNKTTDDAIQLVK